MKKILALVLSLVMVASLAACGGGSSSSGGSSSDSGSSSSGGEGITIFNSKMEIQSQMEEMAAQYSEAKGIPVEVYYSSDTVAAHMSTRYASNEPYTIAMVDA
ncbi:MAG: carbohydrate ABC transporter substrate-binding protein, partial [Oscillospiraceae bacterium]|nr:carbohydrate ABC transporter substrate-binding protein [Oscillospiraceae bacterium]